MFGPLKRTADLWVGRPQQLSEHVPPCVRPLCERWLPGSYAYRAGLDGEATYPMVQLSSGPRWHPDVEPGGVMRQEHDVHLLAQELGDRRRGRGE